MHYRPNDYSNVYSADILDWPVAKGVWLAFSQDCPQFGISGTEQAFSKFIRTHRDELHAAGVVVRLSNSTWLGHPTRFREAIAAKLAGRSLQPLRRAASGDKPRHIAIRTTIGALPKGPT